MTWIIGIAPPFGQSILVSDICVTFPDTHGRRSYVDCLQKIYPMGRFILGGFAGSIKIGFALLSRLQFELSQLDDGEAWNIEVIAHTWWPRLAKYIFDLSEDQEKQLGSQIILASAHPRRNRGDAPSWPWTDVYKFSWPAFEPQKANYLEALTIGSDIDGRISRYVDDVRETCSEFSFMELAVMGEVTQANFIAHNMGRAVEEAPLNGVSRLFQVGIVTRGTFAIVNHEYSVFSEDGTQTNVRFPLLAKSHEQFLNLCRSRSIKASCASC